jgi:predicted ABC-type ATPase
VTGPQLVVIGGANGAGKSTLANAHIPDLIAAGKFLNADEVAKQLAPEDRERAAMAAGRTIVRARRELLSSRQSFAIESTLASRRRHELGLRYLPLYVEACQEVVVFDVQHARSRRIFRKKDGRIEVADVEEMEALRQAVERHGGSPTF